MKNFIYFSMLTSLLVSCASEESKFTSSDWMQTTIYFNENKTDSFIVNDHIKFLENGDMLINKYNLSKYKYKIKGKNFFFIDSDTVSTTYNIIECPDDQIMLEQKEIVKYNNKDTLLYRLVYYKKTKSYEEKPFDMVLLNMSKFYDIGKADTLGDGTIFYNYSAQKFDLQHGSIYDNPYKAEPKIKGVVDKTLGILPKVEKKKEFSEFSRQLYNYYEWETLDFILKMETSFESSYKNEDYLNIKIWITEK